MADHRPDAYEDNGRLVFRASSITRCSKSIVAAALNMEPQPPPDVMRVAWDEGGAAEGPLLAKFCRGSEAGNWDSTGLIVDPAVRFKMLDVRAMGSYKGTSGESFPYMRWDLLDDDQFTFEIPVGTGAVIRGHMDGISEVFQVPAELSSQTLSLGSRAVVEAKFFGVDYFAKYLKVGLLGAEGNGNEPFVDYAWQVSLYMHATGLPAWFVVGEKLRWNKMPESVGSEKLHDFVTKHDRQPEPHEQWDIGNLHVTRFDKPLIPLPKIKMRVMKLVKLIEAGELGGCDRVQYPCAYSYLHDGEAVVEVDGREGKSAPEPVKLEGGLAKDVHQLAARYKALTSAEGEMKAEKKDIAAKLDKLLPRGDGKAGEAGLWEADGVIVEWVHSFTPGTTKTVTTKDSTRSFPKITIPKKVEG